MGFFLNFTLLGMLKPLKAKDIQWLTVAVNNVTVAFKELLLSDFYLKCYVNQK